MEVKVVIPSHRRAGKVTAHKMIDKAIICVPKSQEKEYREHYPDVEIDAHPDSVVGLPPKRQWIMDKYGDVFMIDDDTVEMHNLY